MPYKYSVPKSVILSASKRRRFCNIIQPKAKSPSYILTLMALDLVSFHGTILSLYVIFFLWWFLRKGFIRELSKSLQTWIHYLIDDEGDICYSFFFQLSSSSHPDIFEILSLFWAKHCLYQCQFLRYLLNQYNIFMCGPYLWLICSQKGLGSNREVTQNADAGTFTMYSGHHCSASCVRFAGTIQC